MTKRAEPPLARERGAPVTPPPSPRWWHYLSGSWSRKVGRPSRPWAGLWLASGGIVVVAGLLVGSWVATSSIRARADRESDRVLLATQSARAVTGVESAENAQFRHREPTAAPAVLALLPGVERAVTAMGDPSIGPVLERYSSAVRSVEASLQVGDTAGALRIEQTAVNPAADQLIGVASRFAASQSARADRGLRHADRLALAVHVGTVGLVAAILGLLWLFGVRAERARRRLVEFHEARFRTVVSRGTDAIALVEPSGLVLFASDSCEEVLGSHLAALEGKPLLEAFPRDERERVSGALAAVRTHPEQPVVIRIVVEDPDLRFLEITTVSKLGDPTVRAIVVNVRDITRRRLAEMALGRSEALLRELLDWAPVLVYVKDLDGRFLKVDKAWLQATGLSQEQAIGSIASEILPRRDAELDAGGDRAALRGGGYQAEEVVSLAGQRRVLLTARFPLVDGDGVTYAVGGISMDITDRVRLRETERLLDAVVTHSTDAILGVHEGQITSWNLAAEELLGYTADEVIGTPAASLFASAGLEDEQASRSEEVQSGAVIDASLVTCLHRNGTPVRAELTTTPVHDSEGRSVGVSAILHAVSDLPSQASGASGVDELTGLPTWASLVDQMAQILNLCALEGFLGGVLFMDLDEFGLVNDSLGHDAGDEVLRVVADRLRRAIRSGDLLARHGGDEFVVVRHPVSDRDELVEYAGRLCQAVAEPVKYRGDTLVVTASVGVALTPARNTMLWVQDAGFAMQEAKRAGGAKVHLFDETIASQVRDRITLRNDLRHAVDNAAVVAHYQPILDLRTGHLAGFEALARWRHPQRGWVAPDTFIPLAEETGVIVELGLAMARQACEQLVTWQ